MTAPMTAMRPLPPIVTVAQVEEHRRDVVLCDVRWYLDGRDGRDSYLRGHVPGAVYVELDTWLAAPASPEEGRHPLPSPDRFAEGMSSLGVGDDSVVVAYDDQGGGMAAARLVWMLRSTGHEAALLDGGLQAWPGGLEEGEVSTVPARFTPMPWPDDLLASADDVAQRPSGTVLVDARAPERYRGDAEPVDPRAGHVPGAVNVPWTGNLAPGTGRFLQHEALRSRFLAAGVREDRETIVYCGSGVTACHDALAIEAVGLGRPRLFAGSWSQWSADRDRPATTGDAP